MRPVPWIRLNGSLNRRVLDRWMGSVLTECLVLTGSSVRSICEKFSLLVPIDVMLLLEILRDMKCLQLIQIQTPFVGLFTNSTTISEGIIQIFSILHIIILFSSPLTLSLSLFGLVEVNIIYNPDTTYVKVCSDAVQRFSLFLSDKKYSSNDFF